MTGSGSFCQILVSLQPTHEMGWNEMSEVSEVIEVK